LPRERPADRPRGRHGEPSEGRGDRRARLRRPEPLGYRPAPAQSRRRLRPDPVLLGQGSSQGHSRSPRPRPRISSIPHYVSISIFSDGGFDTSNPPPRSSAKTLSTGGPIEGVSNVAPPPWWAHRHAGSAAPPHRGRRVRRKWPDHGDRFRESRGGRGHRLCGFRGPAGLRQPPSSRREHAPARGRGRHAAGRDAPEGVRDRRETHAPRRPDRRAPWMRRDGSLRHDELSRSLLLGGRGRPGRSGVRDARFPFLGYPGRSVHDAAREPVEERGGVRRQAEGRSPRHAVPRRPRRVRGVGGDVRKGTGDWGSPRRSTPHTPLGDPR